jgi:peptide/nickel transport system permease protein
VTATATAHAVPHAVSPGLWALAWKRLKSDRVGMVSLAIVAAFVAMMALSATGLVAADWSHEVGVNYAPPAFLGEDVAAVEGRGEPPAAAPAGAAGEAGVRDRESEVVDPIGEELAELRGDRRGAPAATADDGAEVVDPLAGVLAEIKAAQRGAGPVAGERRATLPFGADKWGRDILLKTVKGSQTSIFVGLAAAFVAVLIGTVFGALAGYYGRWVDDFFNWFYNLFFLIFFFI